MSGQGNNFLYLLNRLSWLIVLVKLFNVRLLYNIIAQVVQYVDKGIILLAKNFIQFNVHKGLVLNNTAQAPALLHP